MYDFAVQERRFATRNTRIRYPDSPARYLRVKIADEGEGPLEIAGAAVFFVKETLSQDVPWPVTSTRIRSPKACRISITLLPAPFITFLPLNWFWETADTSLVW